MNIFNNISNDFDSDYESDLDISWIKEQEKLQQINENYFKEPMEAIDMFFIYINTNDYIEKIVYGEQKLVINPNNNSIIPNEDVIQLIENNKYLANNKYKILDILLYNVSLQPENIQSYSQNDNVLDTSSKFIEPLSIINDFVIPPSIFIFHKINSLFFIFKQLEKINIPLPKPILKSCISNITPSVKNNETSSLFFTDKSPTERNYEDAKRPNFLSVRCNINNETNKSIHKSTKKVRIMDKEPIINKVKMNNRFTRKQKK
jgi:hypothetical protein